MAPAQGGVVHNVVMHQGKIVKQLNSQCRRYGVGNVVIKQIVAHNCQQGPQALAAQPQHVADRLVEVFRLIG